MKKYVITGGPNAGKTTTLNVLSNRGHTTVPESARRLIEQEKRKEEDTPGYTGVLPWKDMARFNTMLMAAQKDAEDKGVRDADGHLFLDRCFVDTTVYDKLAGVPPREDLLGLAKDAKYTKIFVMDQLPDYQQDTERDEDPELAKKIHDTLLETYQEMGYDVVQVPMDKPEERANFILKQL